MPAELASEAGILGNENADRAEWRELLAVQRMVGRVGAGEVAHEQVGAIAASTVALLGESARLGRREAEPVHAGVDVDRRAGGRRPAP